MENTNGLLPTLTLRNELTGSGLSFFDRIEGVLYPGYVSSIMRKSTKDDESILKSVGYESAFTNPIRNFGEYIQSAGKMRLETFKMSNSINRDGAMDVNFEFMNNDQNVYTVNNMVIYFAYMKQNDAASVQYKSGPLVVAGGIKNQTRVVLTKYGIKFHHETMKEFFDSVVADMEKLIDGESMELIFEVYIK